MLIRRDHPLTPVASIPAVFVTVVATMLAILMLSQIAEAQPGVPGTRLWAKRYDGSVGRFDTAYGVAAGGGMAFVSGLSQGSGANYDFATLGYDGATGAQLWRKRYDGPASGNGDDQAYAIAATTDGSKVFVTGKSQGNGTLTDYATVAYDGPSGKHLWTRRYNGPGNSSDEPFAIALSPDGSTVFVTGQSIGAALDFDYATVAYNASTGTMLWKNRYDGKGHGTDSARGVTVSGTGGSVFVTGYSLGASGGNNYATEAIDASTGGRLWVSTYNGPANLDDFASGIGASPDGSKVFVNGSTANGGGTYDYATVGYDAATGTQLWANTQTSGNTYGLTKSLAVSPDGNSVFITGYTPGPSAANDYLTVAYTAAAGKKLWKKQYNSPGDGDDGSVGIAVDPGGAAVYVTGSSFVANYDYLTLALNAATGTTEWTNRYNGPAGGNDLATGIAVDPGGARVYATGQSKGSGGTSDYDYATEGISAV